MNTSLSICIAFLSLLPWSLLSAQTALKLTPPNPPNKGILFINHSDSGRSGHLGHALVEYEHNKILAFYPNCSSDNGGHSAVGWMEYKRSEDGGKTWGKRQELPFSKALFNKKEGRTAMAEKAVVTDKGEIVLFYLICDVSENPLWQPYWIPLFSKSTDGGQSWSEPKAVCETRGRVYDAKYHNGEIIALHFANDATADWRGRTDEHVYELHVSTDGGDTFAKRSALPFNTRGRGYGTLGYLKNGDLIAFIYNTKDEQTLDYVISSDGGKTWLKSGTSRLSRKIRNPQFNAFDGRFFMHGRSGAYGDDSGHMILYTSADGLTWDDGVYLRMKEHGNGAYSNSIVVGTKQPGGPQRLLIQASHAYKNAQTNVLHWWVEPSDGN
jgi:hypothetical protein